MPTKHTDSTRLRDFVSSTKEADELLDDAERMAGTPWEMDFVADIVARHSKWGLEMYFSAKQFATLKRIAEQAR